jgi:hypothetical protein
MIWPSKWHHLKGLSDIMALASFSRVLSESNDKMATRGCGGIDANSMKVGAIAPDPSQAMLRNANPVRYSRYKGITALAVKTTRKW